MSSAKQDLIPQTEEDIIKAEWITCEDFMKQNPPVYGSIIDVLNQHECVVKDLILKTK